MNEIVTQVNNEKESIKKYGGYYIGRYEVGRENNSAVIKQDKDPYTNIIWSKAYELANSLDVGTTASSYLCSSYAWDTAIKFIQTHSPATNYAISRENLNGNWVDTEVKNAKGEVIKKAGNEVKLHTGLTTCLANIYDLGGNMCEFTTELNSNTNETVILRGCNYNYAGGPAGCRWDSRALDAVACYGFRTTLFLK